MKSLTSILVVASVLFASLAIFAADVAEGPGVAAEKFFAGYVAQMEANKDTKIWIAKSKLASKAFKAAYAKAMSAEVVDADPVIQAQDTPSTAFKPGKDTIKDDKATVLLTAKFGEDAHKVTVQLVLAEGAWLINKITLAK